MIDIIHTRGSADGITVAKRRIASLLAIAVESL